MDTAIKVKSLRLILLTLIVGLVVATLLLSNYLTSKLFLNTTADQLLKNTKQWASVVADQSINPLQTNDYKALNEKLIHLNNISYINYIHVYKISSVSGDIKYFTSYNHDQTQPPTANKIEQIKQLSSPKINGNIIEFITPVNYKSGIIGYVYIQSSTKQISTLRNNILITVIVMLLVVILISVLIILKVDQLISASTKSLLTTVEKVVKAKDYSITCEPQPFKEFDILRHNINILLSRTQKHISKLDADKEKSLSLNKELAEKVTARTDALKESNQDLLSTLEKLHQFQGQIVESEKMASLGDMVAGVAHEVNTPIGLGVTASTLLSDRLNEIKTAFENKSLRSSQLKKFLDDGQENVDIIFRNLNRAANLISSFKKVSVNQSSEETTTFKIDQLINDVLLTLAPQLKSTSYNVTIDCPEELLIKSKAGPLNQIFINLILNSVIHGFDGRTHGEITISVMELGGQLHVQYKDDGVGMHADFKAKAFDPFTTTKRSAGGSGLGLHLVYNLVTQALDGTITLESEVNQGVIFDINFPVEQ